MRTRWRIGITLALAALVIFGLSRTLFRSRPLSVEASPVELGTVEDIVANSEAGTVMARFRARLSAERAGRVVAIPWREGASVGRGAVVLRLDPSSAMARLEAARRDRRALDATHEATHSAARLARRQFERMRELEKRGLVPPEQMDETATRLDAADAELAAAEARLASGTAAVALARDELAHLDVVAPFDGVITRRFVEPGESVLPGQPVLELASLDRLYVSAPIDERDAGRLTPGLVARVTVDAYPDARWPATVTRVGSVLDVTEEHNRTLEIEAELGGFRGAPPLRPGMTADVEIVVERRDRMPRVPSVAVIDDRRVLVASRGRAVTRPIEIGLRNWQWTEVRDGLRPGELVITSLDRPGLEPGTAIQIARPRSSPGATAADTSAAVRIP